MDLIKISIKRRKYDLYVVIVNFMDVSKNNLNAHPIPERVLVDR